MQVDNSRIIAIENETILNDEIQELVHWSASLCIHKCAIGPGIIYNGCMSVCDQILRVEDGKGIITIGNTVLEIALGEIAIIPSNNPYKIVNKSQKQKSLLRFNVTQWTP